MDNRIKVVDLKRTCDASPSQWEGLTENGMAIYIRYRSGVLSAGAGDDIELAAASSCGMGEPPLYYADATGDGYGYMSQHRMMHILADVVDFSRVQSPEYIV